MKTMHLYEDFEINIPLEFESMKEEEESEYYPNVTPDYAFINRKNNSVIGALLQKDKVLTKKDVKKRIMEYMNYYIKVFPGFQLGEMMMRRSSEINAGVLTYKSDAPNRTLYNILVIANYQECELLLNMSCNIEDSIALLPKFTAMIESMQVKKEHHVSGEYE